MFRFAILSLLLVNAFLISGCSTLDKNQSIDISSPIVNLDKLKIGDIVITGKDWTKPISWFGHSAVMISKYKVGEYPKLGRGYYETDIILWLRKKKDLTVLRYDKFDKKFEEAFLRNLLSSKNKQYQIINKRNDSAYYCSQFIWYLYWKTAQDLGYELDIDKDGGFLVTPFDLLNSQHFSKVKLIS
jgi:hypothetical protein